MADMQGTEESVGINVGEGNGPDYGDNLQKNVLFGLIAIDRRPEDGIPQSSGITYLVVMYKLVRQ